MSYMKKHGFDVLMVSSEGKEWEEVLSRELCPSHKINMTRKISPLQDLWSLLKLILLFRKERPDIVHTHTPKAGLLGMLAGKFTSVPLRIHTIAGLPLMSAIGLKKKLLISTEKLTYWASHYVLPNSKSIVDYLKRTNLLNSSKLEQISHGSSNGIDLQRFSLSSLSLEKIEKLKRKIHFNSDNIYLLSVGRMVNDKGIPELVQAFCQLKNKYDHLKLILLGPFESERNSEKIPDSTIYEIKNNLDIIHINWSDEVEYYMSIASFLIHPSHREGLPNVILQAGAMECPVICSDIPGNIDLVTHEETGLLFEKSNVEDLILKIEFAIKNRDVLKNFGLNLKQYVQKYFDRMVFHQKLLDFYRQKLELVD